MTGEPREVFIVTSGEYSDYGINSVWLTYEEAKAEAGDHAGVEVWPVGMNRRSRGTFSRSAQVDYVTGEVHEEAITDWAGIAEQEHVSVLVWPGTKNARYKDQLGIRVSCETEERTNKVYSEVRARVLAEISSGVLPELIADQAYVGGSNDPWRPTQRRIVNA